MSFSECFFWVSLSIAIIFYVWRVGFNLSITSIMLGMLCVLHGPAYWYYTRIWGPETEFYEHILLAASKYDVISTLDIALGLMFLFVCVGIIFSDLCFGSRYISLKRAISNWSSMPLSVSPRVALRTQWLALLLIPSILLPFMIIDGQIPKVFMYFTSGLDEFGKIAMRRELAGSNVYFYNLLVSNFFPFVSYCLLILALFYRKKSLLIAGAFIGLIILAKAAVLSKAPLAVFVLQLLVVKLMCNKLELSVWVAIKVTTMATLFFVAMSIIANPNLEALVSIFDFLFYRIFMIVNEGLVEYFSAIPYVIPHSWGSQFSWVAALFQKEPQMATYWLVGEVHRGVMGSTTTVMFLADAWADFAWYGVCVISFLVGVLVRWLDIELIVKRGKTVESIAGIAAGHFGVFTALNISFQTALITGGLIFIIPFVMLLTVKKIK